jgi:hypothetical protein
MATTLTEGNGSYEMPDIPVTLTRPPTPSAPQLQRNLSPTNPFFGYPRNESSKEKHLNKPTPFHGDRKKIEVFIQECRMYLRANRGVYIDDEDKITFILSYMDDKEALRWKQTFLRHIMDENGEMYFPTTNEFIGDLMRYFQPTNTKQDAAHQLTILRQGKKTAEEIVTEFRLLTSMAGYSTTTPSDHMHLIEKFRRVLNPSLTKKIMLSYNAPTTIDGWVEEAIKIDAQYRQTMEIMNEQRTDSKPRNDKKTPNRPGWTNYFDNKKNRKEHDPDAMDIDRLSPEKRATLMKKGACFICEEPGHMAKDHDEHERKKKEKKKTILRKTDTTPTTTISPTTSTKKKDLDKIHALLQTLSAEETETLLAMKEEKKEEKEEDDSDSDF